MIIANGTIQGIKTKGGGLDEKGYPIETQEYLLPSVRCQIRTVIQDNLSSSRGEPLKRLGFEVLINGKFDDVERVILTKEREKLNCTIIKREYLRAVNQTKLTL